MDGRARTLLTEIYRPEVARLAELLGKPPPWGPQWRVGQPPTGAG